MAALLPLAAMACATAQSGSQGTQNLKLATGAGLNYSMLSTMDMTQSMGGQDMHMLIAMDGSMILTAKEQSSERFAWNLDMQNMHVSSENPMMAIDTTISMPTQRFTTTPMGRLLNVEAPDGKGSEMSQMMTGLGGGREQLAAWFSPLLGSEHKIGDKWQVETNDTVNNEAMGMEMRRKWTTTYTYEATVDTLGTKAARLRVESSGMNIEGEMSVQGMSLGVDGDGAISSVSYYSLTDGLLLASKTENQMNMQVSMSEQGGMVIPITQRMNSTIVRRSALSAE
jgi:hypothetical protein